MRRAVPSSVSQTVNNFVLMIGENFSHGLKTAFSLLILNRNTGMSKKTISWKETVTWLADWHGETTIGKTVHIVQSSITLPTGSIRNRKRTSSRRLNGGWKCNLWKERGKKQLKFWKWNIITVDPIPLILFNLSDKKNKKKSTLDQPLTSINFIKTSNNWAEKIK